MVGGDGPSRHSDEKFLSVRWSDGLTDHIQVLYCPIGTPTRTQTSSWTTARLFLVVEKKKNMRGPQNGRVDAIQSFGKTRNISWTGPRMPT
jgi:hypothetical protein